jgi:nucleoside-diphosphate-sugar epimerase
MIMSGKRIFLTGSSGLVGNRCLIRALQQGYDVIASVRTPEKANTVRRGISSTVGPDLLDNLTFVIIPDIAIPDCFDDFLSEVDYIVHITSSTWTVSNFSDMNRAHVQPAVNSLLSILSAAKKSKTVEKVVLCSSLAALTTNEKYLGHDIDHVTYTAENRVPDTHYQPVNAQLSSHYFAGQALALNATDRLVEAGLPFDVINIHPSTVLGRFEPATTTDELLASSNASALAAVLGKTLDPQLTSCIHVDDVARLHIDVLGKKTGRHHNFGAGVHMSFNSQIAIAKTRFPAAVARGIFPCAGSVPDREFLFGTGSTEEFFGFRFKTFEEMVVDVAAQFLDLRSSGNAS